MVGQPGVQEWRLEGRLTVEAIERWLTELPDDTKCVELKLGNWRAVAPFADNELQGALCLLHRRGIGTVALVPPATFVGDRVSRAFRSHERIARTRESQHLTPTESVLSSTVAGVTVGQLCEFDEAHRHIPGYQRDWLNSHNQIYGFGREKAVVYTEYKRPVDPPSHFDERQAWLEARLDDLLRQLNPQFSHRRKADRFNGSPWAASVKAFALEAVDNTDQHGRWTLDRQPIRSVQFMLLQRHHAGKGGADLAALAPSVGSALSQYLTRLAQNAARSGRSLEQKKITLFVLSVGDGGIGVAASMAGRLSVYEEDFDAERAHVTRALLTRTSSQSGKPGAGDGFRKMLQTCHRMRGLMVIRTGRLRLTRTYLGEDGSVVSAEFRDRSNDAYRFESNDEPLPIIAGTSVSLVFPDSPTEFFE